MSEILLLQLLKIIKTSKKPILKAFEDDSSKASFIDFDTILDDIQKYTKELANSITKETATFNRNYTSETQMIEAVANSFNNINIRLQKLIDIYEEIAYNTDNEHIQSLLSLQISKKVLYDYVIWCEKLENTLIGIGKNEAVFVPNIEIESEIISFIVHNTKTNNLNCWIPFFGGIGLGFLLDDG